MMSALALRVQRRQYSVVNDSAGQAFLGRFCNGGFVFFRVERDDSQPIGHIIPFAGCASKESDSRFRPAIFQLIAAWRAGFSLLISAIFVVKVLFDRLAVSKRPRPFGTSPAIDTVRAMLNNCSNYCRTLKEPQMAEETAPDSAVQEGTESNAVKWILLALAIIFVAGTLYFLFDLNSRLTQLGKDAGALKGHIAELSKRLDSAEADDETLAHQLGLTKKELADRAADLQRQQQAAEARLAAQQKEQIGQVTGEVAGVKTDVSGVKTDVASTKADLAATEAKLQSAIGDLGVQSGLIARTRDDLEVLKHKGDRNYYEFTLIKGARPQPVSTISLQLKKTDPKHGRFTLNVSADDKVIQKKDRNIAEPIQFYTGRDRMLYELVIWTVDKKKATGYLSTPKNAPVPVTAGF
jgi:hypothetical protein